MVHIESYFLDVILQLAVMRQPVIPTIALKIINSMIKDTTIEAQIVEWMKKILPSTCESDDKEDNSTTTYHDMKYWRNFLKRHPQIASKKAVCFNSNHDDWCTHQNFLSMYEMVYCATVKSGVTRKLDHEVWLYSKGEITENKDKAVGRKMEYLLTHLKLVFFVDEVGDNTAKR